MERQQPGGTFDWRAGELNACSSLLFIEQATMWFLYFEVTSRSKAAGVVAGLPGALEFDFPSLMTPARWSLNFARAC